MTRNTIAELLVDISVFASNDGSRRFISRMHGLVECPANIVHFFPAGELLQVLRRNKTPELMLITSCIPHHFHLKTVYIYFCTRATKRGIFFQMIHHHHSRLWCLLSFRFSSRAHKLETWPCIAFWAAYTSTKSRVTSTPLTAAPLMKASK